jgi:hypothetical protein
VNLRQRNVPVALNWRRYLLLLAPTLLLLVLAACGGNTPATPPAAISVETGGMALPGAASAADPAAAPGAATADASPPAPAAATARPILAAGAELVPAAAAVLYAEPDFAAARFAEYAAGSRFTVMEPDGDYGEQPVIVDGQRWYRVRAEDGLAGWLVEEPASME